MAEVVVLQVQRPVRAALSQPHLVCASWEEKICSAALKLTGSRKKNSARRPTCPWCRY